METCIAYISLFLKYLPWYLENKEYGHKLWIYLNKLHGEEYTAATDLLAEELKMGPTEAIHQLWLDR